MQYLLLVYTNESAWDKFTPAEQQQGIAAYTAYGEALKKAGALLSANRLRGTSSSTTVTIKDGKTQVLNGPYVDSREQLGGFFLIEAPDLDAALSWAARCPGASHGTVEVRPIWQM